MKEHYQIGVKENVGDSQTTTAFLFGPVASETNRNRFPTRDTCLVLQQALNNAGIIRLSGINP